ncbi:MAG: nuclear transport factor 2 family protein [Frankiaceae bacterium]|nr:nuclear transport factor 2 family protein [Frankiaceae bacterium]
MNESTELAVVTAYLADHDSRYLAEDVVLDLAWESGVRRGRAAVAAWLYDVHHRFFRDVEERVTAVAVSPGQVCLEVDVSGLQAQVGRRTTMRVAVVLAVAGGEIHSARVYGGAAIPASLAPAG